MTKTDAKSNLSNCMIFSKFFSLISTVHYHNLYWYEKNYVAYLLQRLTRFMSRVRLKKTNEKHVLVLRI